MERIYLDSCLNWRSQNLQKFIFNISKSWERTFFLIFGGETEAYAHAYTAAPKPPGRHKWGPLPEEDISPEPYSPPVTATLVLCGHTVSSVKELIQVKINHFTGKLVLPWWLSCWSSLYSCRNSSVTKREKKAHGQKGEGADCWARGAQDAPEELYGVCGTTAEACTWKQFCIWLPLNQSFEPIWLFRGHVKRF